ncbi:MAG: domain containing protein [Firmicutes bacterium]|nr:domain containing protein [Bacillota bacterium]
MPDNDGIEVELKLRLLNDTNWGAVFAAPAVVGVNALAPSSELLDSRYFDSPDHALQKAGLAYRIRREDGRWIATVKAGGTSVGGLHERREWNVEVAQDQPSIEPFIDTDAGELLMEALGDKPLIMVLGTVFERYKTILTTMDGSVIELAVDRGKITAGEFEELISEVELELKAGKSAAVLALGAELASSVPMTVEPRSKFFRGLCLAGLAEESTQDTVYVPDMTANASAGISQLLVNQIHNVFIAQDDFLAKPAGAEGLHKLRMELRRLRSLLSFSKPLADLEKYVEWQGKLSEWSRSMNRLREIDVALNVWLEATDNGGILLSPPPWLGLLLTAEREKLAQELVAVFSKGCLSATLLGLWVWGVETASPREDDTIKLGDFAAERLAEWIEILRNVGKDANIDEQGQIHTARIQGKKLRYVLEALSQDDAKTKRLLVCLKRLQTCLGTVRDGQLIGAFLNEWMDLHASRIIYRDAGIIAGWMARDYFEARRDFEPVWQRFRRSAKRWLRSCSNKHKRRESSKASKC